MRKIMDEKDYEVPSMLTTIDNPFNPHTNYDSWRTWDVDMGYNTEELLGRYVPIDRDSFITDVETESSLEIAYDQIIESDPFGVYVLVNYDGSIDTSDLEFDSEVN